MNQSDTVEEKDNNSTNNGPGDQLQAARIQQGLSIEDVATRMHLSLGILKSIEENNFDNLTAPIFVKGYLRAYARLVSLDENDLIQRYVEFYSNEDPPINTTSQMVPEISAHDARIKWTTYLVIIILIALLSAWWWNKAQNISEAVSLDADQPSDSAITEQVAEPEITNVLGESGEVVDETSSELLLEEISDADYVDDIPVDNPLVGDTLEGNASAELVLDELEAVVAKPIATDTNTVEPDVIAVLTTEEMLNTTVGLPFDISRTAPVGTDLLNITVKADTWADIKDANDHRLVYDLLRANLSIQIRGKAPFNAFFGNGHGVDISFNSQSIDIASHTLDDNTARLTIGTN
ncbi:MAG: cytoskeleton protein RodZ [Urechidicola sp.]|jgi:cytoskeleton protein RodZ